MREKRKMENEKKNEIGTNKERRKYGGYGNERKGENKRKRGREANKGERRNRIERERERIKKQKKGFSRLFDGQNSTVREEKLIHSSRTTRGYQNLGVSSNSAR